MFLAYFHAPGKASNDPIMKIPLTQTKLFSTFSLISTSCLNAITTGGRSVFHQVEGFLPRTLKVIKVHARNLENFQKSNAK